MKYITLIISLLLLVSCKKPNEIVVIDSYELRNNDTIYHTDTVKCVDYGGAEVIAWNSYYGLFVSDRYLLNPSFYVRKTLEPQVIIDAYSIQIQ